jgi:hypothetical protein
VSPPTIEDLSNQESPDDTTLNPEGFPETDFLSGSVNSAHRDEGDERDLTTDYTDLH